jgi:hypothetical protein
MEGSRHHPALRGIDVTQAEQRAEELVNLVDAGERVTTQEVALRTGFAPQAAAVAMETLRAINRVEKVWEPENRIWRWVPGPQGQRANEPPPREDRLFTIAEAAAETGLSAKAIRSRIDRGTLTAFGLRRRKRVITHEALLRAGLLPGTVRTTATGRRIARMVQQLRGDPARALTTEELRQHAGLRRQVCELALTVLKADGVVTRDFDEGYRQYTWTWAAAD